MLYGSTNCYHAKKSDENHSAYNDEVVIPVAQIFSSPAHNYMSDGIRAGDRRQASFSYFSLKPNARKPFGTSCRSKSNYFSLLDFLDFSSRIFETTTGARFSAFVRLRRGNLTNYQIFEIGRPCGLSPLGDCCLFLYMGRDQSICCKKRCEWEKPQVRA